MNEQGAGLPRIIRITERLADAIAQLNETHDYLLHPLDAAAISRVAAELAALKLEIEQASFQTVPRVLA